MKTVKVGKEWIQCVKNVYFILFILLYVCIEELYFFEVFDFFDLRVELEWDPRRGLRVEAIDLFDAFVLEAIDFFDAFLSSNGFKGRSRPDFRKGSSQIPPRIEDARVMVWKAILKR